MLYATVWLCGRSIGAEPPMEALRPQRVVPEAMFTERRFLGRNTVLNNR